MEILSQGSKIYVCLECIMHILSLFYSLLFLRNMRL